MPHRLLERREGNTLEPAGGHGGGGVAEVVAARQGKFETAHAFAVLEEIDPGAIAPFLAGDGGEGHPIGPLGRPPAVRREGPPQNRAVAVGQQAAAAGREALQGGHQGGQVGVVVGVIEFEVGDHAQLGGELHQ